MKRQTWIELFIYLSEYMYYMEIVILFIRFVLVWLVSFYIGGYTYWKRYKRKEKILKNFGYRTHTHTHFIWNMWAHYVVVIYKMKAFLIAKSHYICVMPLWLSSSVVIFFFRRTLWPFDCLYVCLILYLNFIYALIYQTT